MDDYYGFEVGDMITFPSGGVFQITGLATPGKAWAEATPGGESVLVYLDLAERY